MNTALPDDALWRIGLGVVGSFIFWVLLKAISWFVARRPAHDNARRLRDARAQLRLLEKLGASDRAVILFGFKTVFFLIAFGSLAVVVRLASALSPEIPLTYADLVYLIIAVIVLVVSFYSVTLFRKLEDPESSMEKLRQKIADLEAQERLDHR